jgi:hypothetical protein
MLVLPFLFRWLIEENASNPRVGIGHDFNRDLHEVVSLPGHQVGAQADLTVLKSGDREHRHRLVPIRTRHDPPSRGPVVATRTGHPPRVAMCVTQVIEAETIEEVIQIPLLPRTVRFEAGQRTRGLRPRRHHERSDQILAQYAADQSHPRLRVLVFEAITNEHGVPAVGKDQDRCH